MRHLFRAGMIAIIVLSAGPASAATRTFNAGTMNVSRVVPVPALAGVSTALGSCTATLNDQTGEVSFLGTFSGLNAPPTGVHLRGPAGEGAGPAPVIVPASMITSGVSGTFAGNGTITVDLIAAMVAGTTYCEIRDTPNFASGEIRGQLVASQAVSATPSWAVMLLGTFLIGAAVLLLRRRAVSLDA